jgi:hypothetical protein
VSGNGGCGQFCSNTDGSFECSCDSGYNKAADNLGCNGRHYSTLIIRTGTLLLQMWMNVKSAMEGALRFARTPWDHTNVRVILDTA